MKKHTVLVYAFIITGTAYLLFWPVPINPVAWEAPKNKGYTGAFARNEALNAIERIGLNSHSGPEDVAIGPDGLIYMSSHDGSILSYNPQSNSIAQFANSGGRPLGIEFGTDGILYIADAYRGLIKIDTNGKSTVLTDSVDNSPILYADDLDVTKNGIVYFTDASTKFGAEENGGTLQASLLDLMEHGPNGRVLKYDPSTGTTKTILAGLSFANGLALTADEKHILVVETGNYLVRKIPLARPEESTVIVANLPGFPDNINRNADGTFWLGLVSPRSKAIDALSGFPFVRKIIKRLPAAVQPDPQRYGFIIRLDENGNILETLQGPSGNYALTTGAIEGSDDKLYISSLTEPDLGVINR